MEAVNHNRQKKIAVINDLSGFGRCSIAVALPILSAMGVQCCPVPTAIFSNHTGFEHFFSVSCTPYLERYIREWERLGLTFSGIATGFLGSEEQIEIVKAFLQRFKTEDTRVLVDPVMGDYGRLYHSYSPELAARMHELIPYADLLTPNLTEACILTGTPYREDMGPEGLLALCEQLTRRADGRSGPARVVISGLSRGEDLGNFLYEEGSQPRMIWTHKVGGNRSGTGDVFASILAADLVNGVALERSVSRAANFIGKCLRRSVELGIPATDGICIEEYLCELGESE